MYKIIEKRQLTPVVHLMKVHAPWVVAHAQPGQFVIVIVDEKGERVPLTIADIDHSKQSVTIIFQVVGDSTRQLSTLQTGDSLYTLVGPLGQAIPLMHNGYRGRTLLVAGGVGIAPVYPIAKWLHEKGLPCDVVVGTRTEELLFFGEEMKAVCDNYYPMTDDGSNGNKGLVTDKIKELVQRGEHYDMCVAIGPMVMMKFVSLLTKELHIDTLVSLDSLMVDGTGMCGACRVNVGGKVRFTCVEGPFFDGHQVDFDEARRHQLRPDEKKYRIATHGGDHHCNLAAAVEKHLAAETPTDRIPRQRPKEQDPCKRAHNFNEVSLGFTREQALLESQRCLQCKTPQCMANCPVNINIPRFIKAVREDNVAEAMRVIRLDSSLASICGRVCPQENQCEGGCVLGNKFEPVAIGALERYVADHSPLPDFATIRQPQGKKVAVVGSGPSGLACANDLAKQGYRVTIFEALHHAGGVLVYGIPEFRLPKQRIVEPEIENLRHMGVEILTNVIIGKSITIDELMEQQGFEAVYIASGAGLPKFMDIPGEGLVGVVSANELLTRTNLMHGYDEAYATPIYLGRRVAVIGGGNVAMDAARTALRLGSEVTIVYRRSETEMPARAEEREHAKEEGVHFEMLTNPIEIVADENGNVASLTCQRMALGEPDERGRRSVTPIVGSEFSLPIDTVVMALGTNPHPLIKNTTPGLETNRLVGFVIDEVSRSTSRPGVFAGGDAVSGAATVILAMGAGRKAAAAIHDYLSKK